MLSVMLETRRSNRYEFHTEMLGESLGRVTRISLKWILRLSRRAIRRSRSP
jgi:hypothetical protein